MSLPTTDNAGLSINVFNQALPLKSVFRIARGAKTQAEVVIVAISDGQHTGWGEAVPYGRYHESVEGVTRQIATLPVDGLSCDDLKQLIAKLPAGAARNALDCAWWDLNAKQQQSTVVELLSLPPASPCVSAQTLSIDTPQAMAAAVAKLDNPPLVKVKLDNNNIIGKMTAIKEAAPNSKFIVDANEGWSINDLQSCCEALKALDVVLIEQPLPAGKDQALIGLDSPVPLCADESCHTRAELNYLKNRYQVVNIKLDKTGGLTEAVLLAREAQAMGFDLMLGCMVASSLAMAPASLLSPYAQYVDLDGPLLINADREHGFEFHRGVMQPLNLRLWGGPNNNNELCGLLK
ncbi:dipeptide epimerase [Thalassomonas viridans]|uniref:Dipeptide epimerase n=1 Tax=Thalassomonas viridans TaxID=137584 RepID=A0AAE9YXR0_9GAMM|nr:N-acetyl-D-Glu racemase DgcA [Thalassomonas viridans]WDE02935.1 dipeptide epimerase [Thalassomonas viridans]